MDVTELVLEQAESSPPLRRLALVMLLGFCGLFFGSRLVENTLALSFFDAESPAGGDREAELALARFERRKDEVDTLIVGSSLVLRGIDAALLDDAMAQAGWPTRSFVLALPGMDAFELKALVERALSMQPLMLRRVLVSPDTFSLTLSDELLRNRRVVGWHDLATTWSASRGVVERRSGLGPTMRDLYRHWQAWFFRSANVGEARLRVEAALRSEPGARDSGGPPRDFVPLDAWVERLEPEAAQPYLENRRAFLAQEEEYRARVAALGRAEPRRAPLDGFRARFLVSLRETIAAGGAQPVILTLPECGVMDRDWISQAHADGLFENFIDLRSPVEFPELYAVEHRFDRFHVNGAGARQMTLILARELAQLLRAEARTPRTGQ